MRQSFEDGMAVRRWGDGPAIVHLHGLGEAGTCFERLLVEPALAGFTHVVPDLPGYGRSPWPEHAPSLDELADHLAAWLGWLAEPPIVVGHSMGGVLGVMIAERAPGRLGALVNLDGNVSPGDCTYSSRAAALTLAQLREGGFDRLRDQIFADAATSPELRGYHAALRFADPASFHRHSGDLVAISAAETMAARMAVLAVPVTFVAGGASGGICARSRELLDASAVRWTAVEPSGHWVFLDQPARCAAIIAASARGRSAPA